VATSRPSALPVAVVYDGLCLFCIRSLKVVRALDLRRRLELHDANARADVLSRFPQLADADLDDAMYVVDGRGRVYRGFYAFRRIARAVPPLWPLLPLAYVPGVPVLGERVYASVARNRSRLGCRVDPPLDA
jgi:predicted DCC family thiol-disulfide oxidoreductase YuxK